MGTDELYELEIQRLSFYAIEAYKIRDAIESISSIEKNDISAHKKLTLVIMPILMIPRGNWLSLN